MKDHNKTDQILRNKLLNFRPDVSDASKYRFISESPRPGNSYNKYLLSSLIVMLAFSFIYIYGFLTDKKDTNVAKPEIIINSSKNNVATQKNAHNNSRESAVLNIARVDSTSKIASSSASKSQSFQSNVILTVEDDVVIKKTENYLHQNDLTHDSEDQSLMNANIKTSVESDTSLIETFPVISGSETVENLSADEKTKGLKPQRPNNFKSSNQSIYFYYSPEVIWNIIENEKLMQGFGLGWNTYLFNANYIVGTGIGLLKSKGYYQYKVDYNEYLGDYQRLDSISFTWNPSEFSLEQTRHMSNQVVYDTTIQTEHTRVYRDFLYLQLPLTLGYDFIRTNKFSAGFRFSPVLSVLLSNQPVNFRYEAGMNQLIQINRITADRVKTNWQLRAGLSLSKSVCQSLYLEIEPQYIYYFNSVYEKTQSTSSPYGASVRIALGIKY